MQIHEQSRRWQWDNLYMCLKLSKGEAWWQLREPKRDPPARTGCQGIAGCLCHEFWSTSLLCTSTGILPSQEHTQWLFNNLRSYFITYFMTLAPHASGGCILLLTRGFPAVRSSEEHLINEIIVSYIRLTLLNNISTNISVKEKNQHCFLLTLNCSVCMCYGECFSWHRLPNLFSVFSLMAFPFSSGVSKLTFSTVLFFFFLTIFSSLSFLKYTPESPKKVTLRQ